MANVSLGRLDLRPIYSKNKKNYEHGILPEICVTRLRKDILVMGVNWPTNFQAHWQKILYFIGRLEYSWPWINVLLHSTGKKLSHELVCFDKRKELELKQIFIEYAETRFDVFESFQSKWLSVRETLNSDIDSETRAMDYSE